MAASGLTQQRKDEALGMRRGRPTGVAKRSAGRPWGHPRERGRAYQAALAALLAGSWLLAGCEVPKDIDPREIYRQVSGKVDEARLPPPGLDRPFPNLSQVPPRPERPPLALRESVSAELAADRERSRQPLGARPGLQDASLAAPIPGDPAMPGGPPPPPRLANAPAIPWMGTAPPRTQTVPAAGRGEGAGAPRPPSGAATPPEMPETAPAAPPPDLLGPAGPPAAPSPDLLAPAPR